MSLYFGWKPSLRLKGGQQHWLQLEIKQKH
jgi:hypothetical protein